MIYGHRLPAVFSLRHLGNIHRERFRLTRDQADNFRDLLGPHSRLVEFAPDRYRVDRV